MPDMVIDEKLQIGIIGAGKVGTALGSALYWRGWNMGAVASRSMASTKKLVTRLNPTTRAMANPQDVVDICQMVFITTPDDAIEGLAARLTWRAGHKVAHCSGALSLDVLAPVLKAGGEVASIHPLQAFAVEKPHPFWNITVGLEGEGPLLEMLKQIAVDLGSKWIVLPAGAKAVYHASAVMASNYVVTLVRTGMDLLRGLGVPEKEAQVALVALLGGTYENLMTLGVTGALTGPIARGDVGTVSKHVEALAAQPQMAVLYKALGRLTIPIGLAKGTLTPEAAEALASVLANSQKVER